MTTIPTPLHTMRKLDIAIGRNRMSSAVKNGQVTWAEFVKRATTPEVTSETVAEYAAMTKPEQDNIKDVGYFVGGAIDKGVRKRQNILTRDFIVLDIDHAEKGAEAEIRRVYGGYTFVLYSTHKHTPDAPRFRLVFPLTKAITPDKYAPIARKLASWWDIEMFDATTDEAERAMFWPSVSKDGEFIGYENEGIWIDPDAVLGEYDDWTDVASWPKSSRHGVTRPSSSKKLDDPRNKPGWIGAFCRVYDIDGAIAEFLPDTYKQTIAGRYTYVGSTTSNGAVVYEGLWLFSHHESDPCCRREVNAYDLVRIHKFGDLDWDANENTPVNRLPSYAAMIELVEEDHACITENMRDHIADFEEMESVDWISQLETDKRGAIKPTISNFDLIMRHDNALQGVMFNELRQAIVRRTDTPWSVVTDPVNGDEWRDADDLRLRLYIEHRYKIEVSAARAVDAVNLAADQRSFNPVTDYLERLVWDGTPRVDDVLSDHLGVTCTPYSQAVSRKFLCAAVARAFEPGCKFDHCVILEGAQGLGKSTFLRTLAVNPEWFGDDIPHLKGKEVIESSQGFWIVEMSELQAFGKGEIEHIKAFMSRSTDRARLAYGRRAMNFPRRVVFAGTTNDSEYLKDDTGNRRFWPVQCTAKKIDVVYLTAERDQIWAEAVHCWKAGEKLFLESGVEALATEEQAARHLDDGLAGKIEVFLDAPAPEFDDGQPSVPLDTVCARQIWVECLSGSERDFTRAKADQISRAMQKVPGWEKHRYPLTIKNYGRQKAWVRDP